MAISAASFQDIVHNIYQAGDAYRRELYQAIKSTLLRATRRHIAAESTGLTEDEIRARRSDPGLSCRSAAAVVIKASPV